MYAVGARIAETPVPAPSESLLDLPEGDPARGDASVAPHFIRKERRKMFRMLPFGAVRGFAPLCWDSNDPHVVECAFRQRLMRKLPSADAGMLEELSEFVREEIKNWPQARQMSFEEWLDTTNYDENRKDQLRAAFTDLRGSRPTKRQASHIDTFVKTECYPQWKHARMINSRSDAFKAFSGPYFKACEEVAYSQKEFIKHVPVPERPALIAGLIAHGRKYYGTDFTAFESHFIPQLMWAVECQLYMHCLQWAPEDAMFICRTLTGINNMRTRTGCRARCRARRMSGDMCTSLGNGFTNLMLAKFLVSREGGTIEGFVEGDDGIFSSSVPLTIEMYRKVGFTIKIEEHENPCEGSFCGMIFANSGQIIRDPRSFLNKFGWTTSFINAGPKLMNELLRAKALSTCYETPHCPIIGAFARRALNVTVDYAPRFVHDGYHDIPKDIMNVPSFAPTTDTRELFARKFGISPLQQIYLEERVLLGDVECVPAILVPHPDISLYASRFVEVG